MKTLLFACGKRTILSSTIFSNEACQKKEFYNLGAWKPSESKKFTGARQNDMVLTFKASKMQKQR